MRGCVPCVGNTAFRVPDLVIGVVGPTALGVGGVGLDALWIDLEANATAMVLERVERDRDVVVVENVFRVGPGESGSHWDGGSTQRNTKKRVDAVAGDVDVGGLGGWLTVER